MAARSKPTTAVKAASEFDVDAFISGFKRPTFTRQLIQKADLKPQLDALAAELDDLESRIDRLQEAEKLAPVERSMGEVDPLAELQRRYNERMGEHNALADEYNASAVDFTFRPIDTRPDQAKVRELMEAARLTPPVSPDPDVVQCKKHVDDCVAAVTSAKTADKPGAGADDSSDVVAAEAALVAAREALDAAAKDFNKRADDYLDAGFMRAMSVACESHPMSVDAWYRLREAVGDVAFDTLQTAYVESMNLAAPTADFLPRHLRTPTTGTS